VAAVLVTIFSTIENGIYTSVAASLALLLIRIAHPRGSFLGRVTVREESSSTTVERDVFLPLDKAGITNKDIKITPPSPGVIVYRFEESYLYPNASIINSALVDHVKENMRRGRDMTNVKLSDRQWNDPAPRRGGGAEEQAENEKKPILHAVVLDFSTVSHIDTTATQALIDSRNEIEKWVDHPVEFHFATVLSPWIRRALIAGGFGTGIPSATVQEVAQVVSYRQDPSDGFTYKSDDIESGDLKKRPSRSVSSTAEGFAPVNSTDTPFFHLDLTAAVKAAEKGLGSLDDKSSQ